MILIEEDRYCTNIIDDQIPTYLSNSRKLYLHAVVIGSRLCDLCRYKEAIKYHDKDLEIN